MAGGIGSRFWPLSTPELPKQFVDILGCERTLIQLTVDRFQGICPNANFWVVTNEKYVSIVKKQIPTIPANHILAEPAARNTAPCIAWAAWSICQEDRDANIVVTPSDAVVMNTIEFQRVIKNALYFTEHQNAIVTIGIKPNRPETGYGYVHACVVSEGLKGLLKISGGSNEILKVSEFKEKPNLETAEKYFADGNYLWNAGIFVFNVNTITSAIVKYKLQIAALMDEIVNSSVNVRVVKELFPLCEKVSIDYAIMEPAAAEGLVYTHPADFGWSDLGNWQSLHEKLQKDENNNTSVGNIQFFDSMNNVVHMEHAKRVVIQGLDGYILSEKNGQFLICKRTEEQKIKEFSVNSK